MSSSSAPGAGKMVSYHSVNNDVEECIEWTIAITSLEEPMVVKTAEIFHWHPRYCLEVHSMDPIKKNGSD